MLPSWPEQNIHKNNTQKDYNPHHKLKLALPSCSCNFSCHWLKISLALLLSMNFLQLPHKFTQKKFQNKSVLSLISLAFSLPAFYFECQQEQQFSKNGANKMNWISLIILIDAFSTQLTRANGSRFSLTHVKASSWQSHPQINPLSQRLHWPSTSLRGSSEATSVTSYYWNSITWVSGSVGMDFCSSSWVQRAKMEEDIVELITFKWLSPRTPGYQTK